MENDGGARRRTNVEGFTEVNSITGTLLTKSRVTRRPRDAEIIN